MSTLQLVINTTMWKDADLTEKDYPTTWEQLGTVAQKLTKKGMKGLTFSGEYARIGAFFAQAGGGLVKDGKVTANSDESVRALKEVKSLLTSGSTAYASDLGAGWGGEAFGAQKAAMVIEGNWLSGTMKSDYPSVQYKVIPLPSGPSGKDTLQFTNEWGGRGRQQEPERRPGPGQISDHRLGRHGLLQGIRCHACPEGPV